MGNTLICCHGDVPAEHLQNGGNAFEEEETQV